MKPLKHAIALLIAWIGVRLIGNLGAQLYPQLEGLGLDARVFGFAIAATAVVAILAGVRPGWRISGADPQDALRTGSSRSGGVSRSQNRFLKGIVVAELAASAVLLIGAGLGVPYVTLRGRRGGSALAAAAVNALSRPAP